MKSEEISKELEQHEQKMASLKTQMDNLYLEIQNAMPAAVDSWMNKGVEGNIKSNPELVQSMGVEKLKELKAKLTTLIESLPEIVATEFQVRDKWPHHRDDLIDEYGHIIRKEESHLNQVFRNVISNLGGLLDEFGFIKGSKYSSSWERVGQNKFRYAMNPGMNLPKAMMREYNERMEEYSSLFVEIKKTRTLLSEAQAKELWEQA